MDVENIQTIAALKFNDFGIEPGRNRTPEFLGHSIFTTDGAAWKHSRGLIRPTFAKTEIANLESLEIHLSRMLALIPSSGQTVDLQDLSKKLFLDTSTEFIFGKSVESLDPSSSFDGGEFLAAFDEALLGMGLRLSAGRLRFKYFFDKTWKRAYTKVHNFVDQQVEKALREVSRSNTDMRDSDSTTDSPTKYILVQEMAKEIQDPIALRYQILAVFFAARDTTALGLSNTCFLLARHPEVWQELRKTAIEIGKQPLTYELLKSLVYFKYVFFEGVRLLPSVAWIDRTALRDTILPRGGGADGKSPIAAAAGEEVMIHLHALHRDKDIWGDDVDEFKPSRWEGRRVYWEFVPFYGGPRICPAQQMVLLQVTYVLLRLAQEYERLENRDPEIRHVELTRMLTESKNGVKVAFIR